MTTPNSQEVEEKDQEFKVVLIMSVRPTWARLDPVLKRKKRRKGRRWWS